MKKTRVVIADTDEQYILPIQMKFIEEFFEKLELEMITSSDFFEKLFSEPQSIDILIVSEDLYHPDLQKHMIKKIFLLSEQPDNGETGELRVEKIFKYTSLKEIFNEVVGKSADLLQVEQIVKQEPQLIMVYSAGGGSGKTTVALGVAACLAQSYKRVLYIQATWLQTFQRMMENQSPISQMQTYLELAEYKERDIYNSVRPVLRKELFTYLPPFKASLLSLGIETGAYEKLAMAALHSNEYDFVVIDTDSCFDETNASFLQRANKVLMLTEPNEASLFATKQLFQNLNGSGKEKFITICNVKEPAKSEMILPESRLADFVINEYVQFIPQYDSLRLKQLAGNEDIRRIAYMLL